jgi:ADP-ribose pyrophosphatase YjhB (NUDIX family)
MMHSSLTPTVHFCTQCGTAVEHRVPDDDSRIRAVCPACGCIHYDNPKCVVCTIPVYQNKILLCLREIEPRAGFWTLPGGFLECGETLLEGAQRETLEEACAAVKVHEPVYALVDIPHIAQIHVFFRAEILAQEDSELFGAGEETLESRLFALDEIPWDEIAFNSVRHALKIYIADAQLGQFNTSHHTLKPSS